MMGSGRPSGPIVIAYRRYKPDVKKKEKERKVYSLYFLVCSAALILSPLLTQGAVKAKSSTKWLLIFILKKCVYVKEFCERQFISNGYSIITTYGNQITSILNYLKQKTTLH